LQSHDSSFFDFSLDLLPEDIFDTEEILEYIRSNSSTEEENATHEQKTNYQLHRRIRHLEHDLRDSTARCSAEREHRMNLEAVIGTFKPVKHNIKQVNALHNTTCLRSHHQPRNRSIHRMIRSKHGRLKAYII
jgi:isopropylmalate/homocitrate/citramalate synthase